MSAVVWAQPVTSSPPPDVDLLPEYTHLWHGVDGSLWDLNDWTAGVYMQSGVKGMGFVAHDRWTSTSPALPGTRFRGTRAQPRTAQWPIIICTDKGVDWKALCRRWWRSWSPDEAGTWEVIDSAGRSLSVDLRHNPADDFTLDVDPGLLPWTPWMVDAIADFPYWRGQPEVREWKSVTAVPFFDAGGSPPFHIMSSASVSTAEVENVGDLDSWLTWTITGPFDATSITVAGGTITGPAVAAGDTIVVDTSPTNPVAIKNGTTEVSGQFTVWDPRPVPAGQTVPVTFTGAGLGKVSVSITPYYRMGF